MTSNERYDSLIRWYGISIGKNILDWRYIKAQIDCESAMDPRAQSKAGAQGLCQAMPKTWAGEMPPDTSPFNPEHAIQFIWRYMRALMLEFHHDRAKATSAYNCGPGRVHQTIERVGDSWFLHLPSETRAYVPRVARRYDALCAG